MRTHGVAWALLCVFVSIVAAFGIGALAVYKQFEMWCADLPSIDTTDAFNFAQKSTVYAADGVTVLASFQIENRTPLTSLQDVSLWLVQATLDTEDSRFYEHGGVDYWGLLRAVVNNALGGDTQGASTITQQLVKNTVLSAEATEMSLKRKAREAVLATQMESIYSKDEILLMYLNTIFYGDGCYGIEAAAQHYFSKPAANLTLIEAATLAGIPQSPTYYNPVEYPEACLDRRNEVLLRMREEGTITAEEYAAAIEAPLALDVTVDSSTNGIYRYPYFTSYVRDLLLDSYSASEIFAGGLSIYTTLDVKAQEAAEAAVAASYENVPGNMEFAFVAIDPNTGHVLAMIGGRDFYTDQFNIATTKGRPVGSTMKTFTLVTAIEQGINPSTLADCTTPLTVKSGGTSHDVNNMNGIDYGIISIARMTEVSANTGYVRLMLKVTPAAVINTAHRMGITADLPEVATLTLGVADITPLQMASAYGTLATYGTHFDPICITKIVDCEGGILFQADSVGVKVLSDSVAGAATNVLRGVTLRGTATAIKMFDRRPVAAKTGSSDDWKDRWTCAYTPSVSVACWLGDRNNVQWWGGANTTVFVVNDFLNAYLADTPYEDFPAYKNPPYNNSYNEEQNRELGKDYLTKAPNVVGSKLAKALETLEEYPVITVEDYSDAQPKGTVFKQEADTKNRQIILYVSLGPDPNAKPEE